LVLALSLPALAVDLGAPAPELQIKKWVHGEPVLAASLATTLEYYEACKTARDKLGD